MKNYQGGRVEKFEITEEQEVYAYNMSEQRSIYVSGSISHGGTLTREQELDNEKHFYKAQAMLESQGYLVFNPCQRNPFSPNKTWKDYMMIDIELIISGRITDMYMLNNWKESKGARIEHAIAKELELNIVYE